MKSHRKLFKSIVTKIITTTVEKMDMNDLEEIRKRKMEELKNKLRPHHTKIKIEVTDSNFEEEVIKQSKNALIIVDFWASWCMPCKMLSPILEKIAEEHKGKITLAKLDVDRNPRMSQKYRINGIPAVKLFKNGKLVDEFVGALPEEQVRRYIDKHINSDLQ